MISKEKFKKVLDRIISETGKTQEDLAIDMKYGKNYFSEILSPTGKMTEKFSNAFLAKYGSYLENPNNVGRGTSKIFRRATLASQMEILTGHDVIRQNFWFIIMYRQSDLVRFIFIIKKQLHLYKRNLQRPALPAFLYI